MYKRKTKEERKKWWNSLDEQRKAEYTKKYESKRNVVKRIKIILPELTQTDIKRINDNMRRIGMEKYIVLYEEGEILY
jgi:hypothetical protein